MRVSNASRSVEGHSSSVCVAPVRQRDALCGCAGPRARFGQCGCLGGATKHSNDSSSETHCHHILNELARYRPDLLSLFIIYPPSSRHVLRLVIVVARMDRSRNPDLTYK